MFTLNALEIQKIHHPTMRILEVGSGEGDSALPILQTTTAKLDLLDVSEEMIATSKNTLQSYKERVNFICEDALIYLKKADPYDLIYSAWTIHNFPQKDKKVLLQEMYSNLKSGGTLMILDKVYQDNNREDFLQRQNNRYKNYLDKELANAIIEHEIEDATDEYRLDETSFSTLLKSIGFRSVDSIDRIERDCLIRAVK